MQKTTPNEIGVVLLKSETIIVARKPKTNNAHKRYKTHLMKTRKSFYYVAPLFLNNCSLTHYQSYQINYLQMHFAKKITPTKSGLFHLD